MTEVLERDASVSPEGQQRQRRLLALVIAIALAGIAAGIGVIVISPGAGDRPETSTAAAAQVGAEDTAEPTTTAAENGAPMLITEGSDVKAIVQSAEDYYNWLRAENPDPDLLENILDPSCECYEIEKATLEAMRKDGLRASRTPTEVMHARVSSRPADDVVVIWTVERSDPTDLVRTDGQVLATNPAWGPRVVLFTRARHAQGSWRTTQIEDLGPWDGSE